MRSDARGDRDGSPRRLWVELHLQVPPDQVVGSTDGLPPRFVGVTGLDAEDCHRIATDTLGDVRSRITREVWDVDVSSIDGRVPTGNPAALGVWYCGP
jgi:hypothetical protein